MKTTRFSNECYLVCVLFHTDLSVFLTCCWIVYLPPVLSESRGFRQDLHRLARFATSKKVASWIVDAERNLPGFEGDSISKEVLNVWENKKGADLNKNNYFPTMSDGWRKLGEWGAREGFVDTVFL